MSIEIIVLIITLLGGFSASWIGFAQQRNVIRDETISEFKDLRQNQNILVEAIKELREDIKELKQDNKYLDAKIDKFSSDLSTKIDAIYVQKAN